MHSDAKKHRFALLFSTVDVVCYAIEIRKRNNW